MVAYVSGQRIGPVSKVEYLMLHSETVKNSKNKSLIIEVEGQFR